jgi:hypothetical protein
VFADEEGAQSHGVIFQAATSSIAARTSKTREALFAGRL